MCRFGRSYDQTVFGQPDFATRRTCEALLRNAGGTKVFYAMSFRNRGCRFAVCWRISAKNRRIPRPALARWDTSECL